MKGSKDKKVLKKIKKQQSIGLSMALAIGLSSAMLLVYSLAPSEQTPAFALLLPAVISALAIKFIGRPYFFKARLLPAICVGLITACAVFLGTASNTQVTVFACLATLVCLTMSRRSLNLNQERALYRLQHKLKAKQAH
ncbi:MAG: hypothetical protein OIF35_07360 [Cellvibrionaceae bacterium]|nr:hypothetical protein [Cellvibrionaceae bacterium]MCV6624822.1 hypothetical protein [Cellvibrionaceae bacterium]